MTIRSFRPLLERAGLPRIRFHDLRHTAASIPLAHGVPTKIVSEMLGHASTSITDDIYAHVTPTMQRATAAIFDRVLSAR
jgi:integrase